jgi:hypothetical protein
MYITKYLYVITSKICSEDLKTTKMKKKNHWDLSCGTGRSWNAITDEEGGRSIPKDWPLAGCWTCCSWLSTGNNRLTSAWMVEERMQQQRLSSPWPNSLYLGSWQPAHAADHKTAVRFNYRYIAFHSSYCTSKMPLTEWVCRTHLPSPKSRLYTYTPIQPIALWWGKRTDPPPPHTHRHTSFSSAFAQTFKIYCCLMFIRYSVPLSEIWANAAKGTVSRKSWRDECMGHLSRP